MADKEIIIDLNDSLSSSKTRNSKQRQSEKAVLLQFDAMGKTKSLLNSFAKRNISSEAVLENNTLFQDLSVPHRNNTIFVNGERGAGKTTFMREILYDLWEDRSDENKIVPVAFIDPTLVETHQHILVDIIAKFHELVFDKLICCRDEVLNQRVSQALEEMDQGLNLLNSSSHNSKNDTGWFLNKALRKSTSGQNLERHFHNFINILSEEFNIKLFVIAIDDVDTKTDKAYEVLEVIRCYFTHPRLAVIISGDLKLYSHLVRMKKSVELSTGHSTSFGKRNGELAEELEQQYLTKVFPVEQRVSLRKFSDILLSKNITISHQGLLDISGVKSNNLDLKKLLHTILSESLQLDQSQLKAHIDFLINQPVRSVLQFLKTQIEDAAFHTEFKCFTASSLKKSIGNIFIGSLLDENIHINNLENERSQINTLGYELFKLLYNHDELETGFYARPDSTRNQVSYNASKLYFSSAIAEVFSELSNANSISNAIKCMLVGGGAANIFMTYVSQRLKEGQTFENYLSYIGLNRNDRIISIASHFSPIILDQYNPNSNDLAIMSGVLRTPRRKSSGFISSDFDLIPSINQKSNTRFASLSSLYKNFTENHSSSWDLHDYIATETILISSHHITTSTEGRDYISAYSLLASMAELSSIDNEERNDSLAALQTYTYPTFFDGKTQGSDEGLYDDEEEIKNSSLITLDHRNEEKLKDLLKKWIDKQPKTTFSSLLIGKIWARIHYTLNLISESCGGKVFYHKNNDSKKLDVTLGVVFSRFIWTIINSTLIEECRYRNNVNQSFRKAIKNAKNTNTSPVELIVNINKLSGIDFKNNLPFTWGFINCTLLWPFLGGYLEGNGTLKTDLYDTVITLMDNTDDFIEVAEKSEPFSLIISALPIMGAFKKNNPTPAIKNSKNK